MKRERNIRRMPEAKDSIVGAGSRPTRVACYVRATGNDHVESWSIDQQKRAIQEFCDGNDGFTIVETYVDGGRSASTGRTDRRPEYLRMMSDAKARKFDMVISTAIDRLSCSPSNFLVTVETLAESRVSYKSLGEDFDFSGPQGEFILTMLASMAQWYSSQRPTDVRSALDNGDRQD